MKKHQHCRDALCKAAAGLQGYMLYMQEEIAHCAAGVRWLTWLHTQASLACLHANPQRATCQQNVSLAQNAQAIQDTPSSQDSTCSPSLDLDSKRESTDTVSTAAAAASTSDPVHVKGVLVGGQKESAAPRCIDSSCAEEAQTHEGKIPDWQADAQQYGTVEEWFHALVHAHFKGSLKVCSMHSGNCPGRKLYIPQ